MDSINLKTLNEITEKYLAFKKEISKVIVNYEDTIENLVIALFCGGHTLIVGAPGLAKTLLVTSISKLLGLSFKRIQFTPDLMPSDITGVEIFSPNGEFRYIKGPIFANIILADEINRAPPKTQAALLEAMQEKQVTIGNFSYKLPEPFFVIATQNPIEYEGTYPLPEAQLDRFMMMLKVDYPSITNEIEILKRTTSDMNITLSPIFNEAEILKIQKNIKEIPISEEMLKKITETIQKTRPHTHLAPTIVREYVEWGAGPRGSQFLTLALKCYSVLNGSFSPSPEDIKRVAIPILRHRIILNYKAEIDKVSPEKILQEIL